MKAYKAAQYTAFAFAIFAALLAAIFLRGVGVVGHTKPSEPNEKESENIEGLGTRASGADVADANEDTDLEPTRVPSRAASISIRDSEKTL